MPTYTFINKDTNEEHDVTMRMSELDEYKENNPGLKQKLMINILYGGTTRDSGKLPEGFKDKLREMKNKHPHAKGISDHI